MDILGKVLGATGVIVGGAIAASKLLGNNEKKLKELEIEFRETTKEYQKRKAKLQDKANKGYKSASRALQDLEDQYHLAKIDYENRKNRLLPKKSKMEIEQENKEFDQRLEIEKAKAFHEMDIEKTKTIYDLELERDKTYHDMGMVKDKSHHEMEMEKIELAANMGVASVIFNSKTNDDSNLKCLNCGNEIAEGAKFCGVCGKPVNQKRFCTNCGTSLEAHLNFCPMCGQAK